ncbi:BOI-related E3 ubiquitin-protein ligase 1-like [Mangifera indica]|uniref:BOI-related E3 ubiquitin-protein ligase 1-like n=1 Tax=Mangifera indica TaxID=29780 RepID=UPI001CFA4FA2|nr:BOI-related E3 ubiquitin-protein ligase 1-like [Mangifera indica]
MAVEARHIDLFPSQLISHRDFIKSNDHVNNNFCNTQMDFYLPFAESMPFPDRNYHFPRKRLREEYSNNCNSIYDLEGCRSQKPKLSSFSSFLDEDMVFQFQQQQEEIERYIAHHVEKVRLELEERRKWQSRTILSAIQEAVLKKLREKDEEIQRLGKLNWVLQEQMKSLSVENQILRDLAQSNEATANALRSNLEQVLHLQAAHISTEEHHRHAAVATEDDAESSHGSSDSAAVGSTNGRWMMTTIMCRRCGEKESSVLVLPCRHLCLCSACGSSLHGSCPVCHSIMDASLHVNMSP